MRKELRVKGTRFERAFGFVFRPQREDFSRIGSAQENLSGGIAHDAGDLRGPGFGELREHSTAINGEKRAIVSGAGKKASVGGKSQRVNHVFARSPNLFRSAVRVDAVNAARNQGRERKKRRLDLPLSLPRAANAGGNGGWALRRGDDRGRSGSSCPCFLANRRSVDAAVRSYG